MKKCVYLHLQVEEVERLECTDIDTYIGINITNTAFDTLYLSKDNIECGFEERPADDKHFACGFPLIVPIERNEKGSKGGKTYMAIVERCFLRLDLFNISNDK